MKRKLCALFLVGLVCVALLTGCQRLRNGIGNPAGQTAATATNPPLPTQPAPGLTHTLAPITTPAAPAAVEPTQTQPAAVDPTTQPTITAPATVKTDVSKEAYDLSKSLDGLMKDLNSSDDLNDVK
jgi:hypothetical protein